MRLERIIAILLSPQPPASTMFISLEGIDGSGKSTQAGLLADALRSRGREVVEVRAPGGPRLGEQVRALLLDPEAEIHPRAELLLFSAARAQLVAQTVGPVLARGAIVLADRFFDSSTAYQGAGRGLADPAWLEDFHTFVTDGLAPDRTILVDVPLEVAAQRRGDRPADRMERGGDAFYARVRAAYLALADAHPDRILVVDGTTDVKALHDRIFSDVLAQLGR